MGKKKKAAEPLDAVRDILKKGKVVCLTGAGLSCESGIPTFRGKGGLWETYDPEIYGNMPGLVSVFRKDPKKFVTFINDFYSVLLKARPNRAHLALAYLEKAGLLKAVITQNIDNLHQRLDAVKADMARLADPRGLSDAEADAIVRRTPAVTWDNFGNDGNESGAVEAALEMAYRLAASRGGPVEQALRDAVAVIDVCHNPDSRERFVAWYNAHQVDPRGTADPQAIEHDGPAVMDTNYNHYQTDLNRDAAWLTQQETRNVVRAFREWWPLTFVDHHGQTENFFFPPVTLPVNPSIPESRLRWLAEYGREIAAAADRRGWTYFTGEVFDAFYPGGEKIFRHWLNS